ncbi:MAG: hypothetical protein RJP95_04330 [Pirellulales bacterium]
MISLKTIRRGERVAVWSPSGDVRFVDGPKRLLLFRNKIEPVMRFRAEPHQYLVIRFLDGHTEHRRGPAEVWWDPTQYESIEARPLEEIDANEAVLVYTRLADESVSRRVIKGPAQYMPAANEWLQRRDDLRRYSAEAHEYLAVHFLDGRINNLRGPVDLWFDPDQHESVSIENATPVDAHEALVVYSRDADDAVTKRVLRGPAQYVPAPGEWLHSFSWHGADPNDPTRKLPRVLQFTHLRVIPDQMYFDVRDVRTSDDALLTVKLMVFFELADIDKMLAQTHDPIADFINALSADIIDFAADRSFEEFKEATGLLNDLAQYDNLVGRSQRIGYRISKVVYRGYEASDKLQSMHDEAIERRTALKLEAETERQGQELADLKLAREAQRDAQRQTMVRAQAEHEESLAKMKHEGELARQESDHRQQIAHVREDHLVEVEHVRATNEIRLAFLQQMQGLQVDLTRYLVAQYQHPDRLIRVDGGPGPQLHLHDN